MCAAVPSAPAAAQSPAPPVGVPDRVPPPAFSGGLLSDAFQGDKFGSEWFRTSHLEVDQGRGENGQNASWDLDGSFGPDFRRVHFRTEGELVEGAFEQAEFWVSYNHKVSTFWDLQVGYRYDQWPYKGSFGFVGFEGETPYFSEARGTLFVSHRGEVHARLREEYHFSLFPRLLVQPYWEVNFFAQEVSDPTTDAAIADFRNVQRACAGASDTNPVSLPGEPDEMFTDSAECLEHGHPHTEELGYFVEPGLGNVEVGIQPRYIITPNFSPYLDIRYEHKVGGSNLFEEHGLPTHNFLVSGGVRLMF